MSINNSEDRPSPALGTTLSRRKHSQARGSCPGSVSQLAGPCPAADSRAARGGLAIVPKTLLGKDTNHVHVKKPVLLRQVLPLWDIDCFPAVRSNTDSPEQSVLRSYSALFLFSFFFFPSKN